ncbi:MAG: hypothetical protein Kow00109_05480 [Acidobacteriota bacterium]
MSQRSSRRLLTGTQRLWWILVALLVQGVFGWAQQSGGGTKIAFINTTAVLQGTEEGKKDLAALDQFIAEKRQALEQQQQELNELKSQYDRQYRLLNPDTAAEMQRAITDKERKLARAQEDAQLEIEQRRDDVLTRMGEKIQAVIAEYAQQNGIGAVFLLTPGLPYYSEELDITADIIRLYNEKHPVAGAAPGAGGGSR